MAPGTSTDSAPCGSDRPLNIRETEDCCLDYFLSSKPVHPVDSDDDCSIISELSCDVDMMMEDDSLVSSPIDDTLEIQDSVVTSWRDQIHDMQGFGSATIISTTCASPIMDDTCYSDCGDSMSTTTSTLLDDLASLSSNEVIAQQASTRDYTCHFERLPNELICAISSHLDVESLSRARLVNKRLLSVASQDEAGWKHHCQSLWSRKVYVPTEAYSLLENGNARKAFYFASREAVSRHYVLPQELCFNPHTQQGTIWSFRFKATAGAEWTSWDPWWNGTGRAREMVFLKDGRVMQYVRGHGENSVDCLVMPFRDAERGRPIGLEVYWRFISQPMDLPKRPEGSYIRLTIAGRDVPTYIVHRSPTNNWGFVMESCWGVYASFPLKKRKQVHEVPLQRPPRIRLRRTSHGEARWLNVADMESDDEAENEVRESSLSESGNALEDSALSVTTAWQWREAILHNQGLMRLPEGESAAAEFDFAYWDRTLRRGPNVVVGNGGAFGNRNGN